MLPWETLRALDDRRARRRTDLAALEQLEGRQLLSYSSLGYSLPDLKISGLAGPVASWGGSYQVTVVLQNTGASTIIEPLSLVPASEVTVVNGSLVPPYYVPSSADAAASQVGIYLAPRPHSLAGAKEIGTATAQALSQNDIERFNVSLTLPQQPTGFRAAGVYYIRLVANQTQSVLESNFSNNVSAPIPVRFISQALPQLQATALDLPDSMQPGDTVVPTFQITNLGTANTDTQAPVQVALVASVTPSFTLGSSIVALYTLPAGIPGQSSAPVKNSAHHHARLYGSTIYNNNVTPAQNVETFTGAAVTLPTSPSTYYLGLVIDPNNTLKQLSLPANRLELIRTVGPATSGLPPAGVVSTTPLSQPFPNPPDGVPIGNV
ncbi:MAG: hypothetical protein ACXVBB_08665, partial [Isosphaeraceae bacterium]